nr:recombinase family protein [Kribbella sp. VKM Ac-2569]
MLIGYARCSTDKQDLQANRQILLDLGVDPEHIHLDRAYSGTTRARPGLDKALVAVRAGLGAVAARWSGRPVDLDDPLTTLQQVGGEPGAEAAGALDGPDAAAGCMLVGERDDASVAHGVGCALLLRDNGTRIGDHGCGVGVAVSIDTDDVVDLACQHGHAVPPSVEPDRCRHRPGCGHRAAGL